MMRKVLTGWDVARWTKSASGALATLFLHSLHIGCSSSRKKEMLEWQQNVLPLNLLLLWGF